MNEYYTKIKDGLRELGFSDDEIDSQLISLAEIIQMSFVKQILINHPEDQDSVLNNPENYIKNHYNSSKINGLIENIAKSQITTYLEEITKGLPEEKVKNFFDKMDLSHKQKSVN